MRRTVRLFSFNDSRPNPSRFHSHVGKDVTLDVSVPGPVAFNYASDQLESMKPAFSRTHVRNNYVKQKKGPAPLKQKMQCPWCKVYFDFTLEEYRRDDMLKQQYKSHEDSHTPPPGWEPDPRPMKGKGVTKYDRRHRFGWMLGEEW
eukprot:TRINITY_DN873_c1_g1_i1.p1 TRINITY_DN873_c1_g1~~TRINITY_DN873_c1_g1_i1.p1  ORF type:complete len:153 (+),score=18.72 TRINITY_DN873_c1_g1_i1:22-459(+)